jgi:hypothetical protein
MSSKLEAKKVIDYYEEPKLFFLSPHMRFSSSLCKISRKQPAAAVVIHQSLTQRHPIKVFGFTKLKL